MPDLYGRAHRRLGPAFKHRVKAVVGKVIDGAAPAGYGAGDVGEYFVYIVKEGLGVLLIGCLREAEAHHHHGDLLGYAGILIHLLDVGDPQ